MSASNKNLLLFFSPMDSEIWVVIHNLIPRLKLRWTPLKKTQLWSLHVVAFYKMRRINRQFPVYKWIFQKFSHTSIIGNPEHIFLRKKTNVSYFPRVAQSVLCNLCVNTTNSTVWVWKSEVRTVHKRKIDNCYHWLDAEHNSKPTATSGSRHYRRLHRTDETLRTAG